MENLNAETVKKIKECLRHCNGGDCETCKVLGSSCDATWKFQKDALSLITSQEQRIKELTEENKARKGLNTMLDNELRRLAEENERLRAIPEQMKERLQSYFGTYVLGYKIPLSEALKAVNQIAKEMLEGEK